MSIKDRITDALGGALGYGLDIVTDSFSKANHIDTPAMGIGDPPAAKTIPPEPSGEDPKGLLWDPFALVDQLGYRDRFSGLTYQTLRSMARKATTVVPIIQSRLTQVSSFGQPGGDPRDPGFAIVLRDTKKPPTKKDDKRCQEFETFLQHTGSVPNPDRDDFKTFLKKITRDSLELDQACFETVRNKKGLPAEFYAMDGATIRLADMPVDTNAALESDPVRYVQIYDETIIAEFGPRDLCFGVRNPRTDIKAHGYGYAEAEMLINSITAALWAFDYNKREFSQGTQARGILNFKGGFPQSKLNAFRRQWQMMVSGVNNAHKTPMTNAEEIQWIDFHRNNRDMEYSAWMDFLIKVTCSVYQLDPAEINFFYGNSGQTQQMFASPADHKLKNSKDRGLRPLLFDLAYWINSHIIWHLDPNFSLEFTGLDAKTVDQAVDLSKKEVTFKKTVDEIRAEDDLPPLPDGRGEIILDPTYLQNIQGQQMEEGSEGFDDPAASEDGSDEKAPNEADKKREEPKAASKKDLDSMFSEKSLSADQVKIGQRDLEAQYKIYGDTSLKKAEVTEITSEGRVIYEIEL